VQQSIGVNHSPARLHELLGLEKQWFIGYRKRKHGGLQAPNIAHSEVKIEVSVIKFCLVIAAYAELELGPVFPRHLLLKVMGVLPFDVLRVPKAMESSSL
jgi:hypothetical protein